jgi:hypothetical protein
MHFVLRFQARWLLYVSRNVAGSIPDEVTGFLIDLILLAALWP